MQIATLNFAASSGWSVSEFPPLDSPDTLVLAFGESRLLDDPAPLDALARAYPSSHFLGCSTAGAVIGSRVVDDILSVALVRFDKTRLGRATVSVPAMESSYDSGAALARQLVAPGLKAVLVLSDGLVVNGSDLIAGIQDNLPRDVIATGGLAADGDRFQRTWILNGPLPAQGIISAIGLYGDHVHVGHGSRGGWDIFGPEREVTRSQANVLQELDGKPALALYKSYLGDLASGLPGTGLLFPLSIRPESAQQEPMVRTLLGIDEASQSMTFAGNIPQGAYVRLMKANFDRLIDGASDAVSQTRRLIPAGDITSMLCIAISCVGRRLVLGERTDEELEAALGGLPAGAQQVGFYSYGELSPCASGRCELHNQTMTLTTICEP